MLIPSQQVIEGLFKPKSNYPSNILLKMLSEQIYAYRFIYLPIRNLNFSLAIFFTRMVMY